MTTICGICGTTDGILYVPMKQRNGKFRDLCVVCFKEWLSEKPLSAYPKILDDLK